MTPIRAMLVAAVLLLAASPVLAASPDNNVEWSGVSHVAWQDRRPLCPVDQESFQVRFQAYRNDLTAARVRVEDGTGFWVGAAVVAQRGPYDIWAAQIPATLVNQLAYWIELTDGTDVDYYSVGGMSDGPPGDGGFAIDFTTLNHAPVGATPVSTGGTVFKVWAPNATTAHVRGEFNSWGLTNPMTKVGEHFIGRVGNAVPRQMYKYFFSGSTWNSDARARSLDPSQTYNSRIENPFGYVWLTNGFVTPPLEQLVIYQLHVGTFAGRNDPMGGTPFPSRYVDVAARAGHLADLGVNAVMVNPITEFAGDLSAGYNPVSQWAPEWKYGTPDEFKFMVDKLHEAGIAVLLDIVWNHFSIPDNYLWNYDGTQIYFDTPAQTTPWGDQADFDRGPVRDYFANSAFHWMEEYRVDGFRMDATDFMNIGSQEAAGWSLMQRFTDETRNRWADKILIAEQLPDDPWVTRPTNLGGAGFQTQYFDAFTDRLREEILDAAFGDPEMWKIRDILNGGGQYLSGIFVTNYLELHDEAWPSSGGQRLVKTIDTTFPHDDVWARGRSKLGTGVVFLAPGVPAMLQGTEWLEDTDFGTDPGNRIDWSKKTTYAPIFAYYKDLIRHRKFNSALRANSGNQVFHLNESGNVIGWQRFDGAGNVVVALANFSNNNYSGYRIGLPQPGEWGEVLNSQASAYSGNGIVNGASFQAQGVAADGFNQSTLLEVPQMSVILLQWNPSAVSVDEGPRGGELRLERVYPSPLRGTATVSFRLPERGAVRLTVHDARGREVARLAEGVLEGGAHTAHWSSAGVGAGLYFVRLEWRDRVESAKLVRLP